MYLILGRDHLVDREGVRTFALIFNNLLETFMGTLAFRPLGLQDLLPLIFWAFRLLSKRGVEIRNTYPKSKIGFKTSGINISCTNILITIL